MKAIRPIRSAKSIYIYSSEFLPFKGGVARYTEDMAAMLSDGGFAEVVVLTEPKIGQATMMRCSLTGSSACPRRNSRHAG
jgi:hypothetical protein